MKSIVFEEILLNFSENTEEAHIISEIIRDLHFMAKMKMRFFVEIELLCLFVELIEITENIQILKYRTRMKLRFDSDSWKDNNVIYSQNEDW